LSDSWLPVPQYRDHVDPAPRGLATFGGLPNPALTAEIITILDVPFASASQSSWGVPEALITRPAIPSGQKPETQQDVLDAAVLAPFLALLDVPRVLEPAGLHRA
jgi:hypothetical protein